MQRVHQLGFAALCWKLNVRGEKNKFPCQWISITDILRFLFGLPGAEITAAALSRTLWQIGGKLYYVIQYGNIPWR